MLGAIIGDMVGSIYEFHPIKTKEFEIFNPEMRMTDDSFLTIAVAKAIMLNYPIFYHNEELIKKLQKDIADEFVKAFEKHPYAGFGGMFFRWCVECKESGKIAKPYNSFGNGSAMRISPVGWVAKSEEEVRILSRAVTEITHNHPEGLKGAEAVAMCIYLARQGWTKTAIGDRMIKEYYPEISTFDFEDLIKTYKFSEICQNSVPQAIYCFLMSHSLEDAIRNCVAIGGDCDTTGAMAGAIAEAYYQKDKLSDFEKKFMYLKIDSDVEKTIKRFYEFIGSKKFAGRAKHTGFYN